jgi:hypothetical protein
VNADPLLILAACALLLVVAIWAASHGERHVDEDEEAPTLDTRGPD